VQTKPVVDDPAADKGKARFNDPGFGQVRSLWEQPNELFACSVEK
jgi:hypothetical protein